MVAKKGVLRTSSCSFLGNVAHDDIVSRANGSTFLEISKANFRPIPVITPSSPRNARIRETGAANLPAHCRVRARVAVACGACETRYCHGCSQASYEFLEPSEWNPPFVRSLKSRFSFDFVTEQKSMAVSSSGVPSSFLSKFCAMIQMRFARSSNSMAGRGLDARAAAKEGRDPRAARKREAVRGPSRRSGEAAGRTLCGFWHVGPQRIAHLVRSTAENQQVQQLRPRSPGAAPPSIHV